MNGTGMMEVFTLPLIYREAFPVLTFQNSPPSEMLGFTGQTGKRFGWFMAKDYVVLRKPVGRTHTNQGIQTLGGSTMVWSGVVGCVCVSDSELI